jgi:hypothetical protein
MALNQPTLAVNQFPGSFQVALVRLEACRFQVPDVSESYSDSDVRKAMLISESEDGEFYI